MRATTTRGFTLIELSIVLVIIGLIVGGVLVGRDLIDAARMRAAVSQLQELDTAFTVFRDKYGCPPGDSPLLDWVPHPSRPGDNANCDKKIRDRNNTDVGWGEDINNAFPQLSIAGLINETFSGDARYDGDSWKLSMPTFKWRDDYGIAVATTDGLANVTAIANPLSFPANTTVFFIAYRGAPTSSVGNYIFRSNNNYLHPRYAYDMDLKIDDGLPLDGRMHATNGWDIVGKPNTQCASSTAYRVTSSLADDDFRHCTLNYKLTRQ